MNIETARMIELFVIIGVIISTVFILFWINTPDARIEERNSKFKQYCAEDIEFYRLNAVKCINLGVDKPE